MKFKVGDKVKVRETSNSMHELRGKVGTVIHLPPGDSIGIEFDDSFDGHSCNGRTTNGNRNGYYIEANQLTLITRDVLKVGDKVKRIEGNHVGMDKGDTAIVAFLHDWEIEKQWQLG